MISINRIVTSIFSTPDKRAGVKSGWGYSVPKSGRAGVIREEERGGG